jgi:deoxycytidine triphosphate deaminase
MPILTKNDLHAAMYLGLVEIEDITDISATSFDVRIDKLLTPAMERKDMEEVPLIDGEYWIVGPEKHFLFETVETFHLAPGFHGKINSRSSWARYGVASREADDEFSMDSRKGFHGKVICSLNTLGTTVKIRPGDSLAQAHLAYNQFIPLMDSELEKALKDGRLEIIRRGKRIKKLVQPYMVDGKMVVGHNVKGGRPMNGGLTLTTDPTIKVYTGKPIDPHNPDPSCFEERRLANRGTRIKMGTFFLSASAEEIKIDRHYIGWVDEFNKLLVTSGYHGPFIHPDERPSYLQTHSCAPKIDPYPRFHGKITFENLTLDDTIIKPGQRITEIYLFHLNNPYLSDDEVSRYKGQKKAMRGRAHLDAKIQQLDLPFKKK